MAEGVYFAAGHFRGQTVIYGAFALIMLFVVSQIVLQSNLMNSWMYWVWTALIVGVLFRLQYEKQRKVEIRDGTCSIPGFNRNDSLSTNSYAYARQGKKMYSFKFSLDNVEEAKMITNPEEKRRLMKRGSGMANPERIASDPVEYADSIVEISFNEPLTPSSVGVLKAYPPIPKLYVSVKNPGSFIEALGSHRR